VHWHIDEIVYSATDPSVFDRVRSKYGHSECGTVHTKCGRFSTVQTKWDYFSTVQIK
jgi:hypothetical protein